MENNPWLDIRLSKKIMEYLWSIIDNPLKQIDENIMANTLAGNISKNEYLQDTDNRFYKDILNELTKFLHYKNWNNYYNVYIAKMESHPKFDLNALWVNYQKKHEFNPPHLHCDGNGYTFVVFMKIPTHWKEQHALPISINSASPSASDFQFLLGHGDGQVKTFNIPLNPEDEGRMLFFPAWITHQVFPFYECEEERITISGNIQLKVEDYDLQDIEKEKERLKIERKQQDSSIAINESNLRLEKNN